MTSKLTSKEIELQILYDFVWNVQLTDEEIEIQRALGTLPLWIRMVLGEVKFKTIVITLTDQSIADEMIIKKYLKLIWCADEPSIDATFCSNHPFSRKCAIDRMIKRAKKRNL